MERGTAAGLAVMLAAVVGCGASAPRRHGPFVPTDQDGGFDPPGTVGVGGGAVHRLHFGVTGDTRPANADDLAGYPTPVIAQIVARMAARRVQFALDLGDHMNVEGSGAAGADAQMQLYLGAVGGLGAPWFMALGNHECPDQCAPDSAVPTYQSYLRALRPVSALPFYAFDVKTDLGLARFVVVADNAWSDAQAAWLEQTLEAADRQARYTIVARHHPLADGAFTASAQIVARHHKALVLTGHSHQYLQDLDGDPSGRAVILGTGGAPLGHGWASFGYGVVTQGEDGALTYTQFDSATDAPLDQFRTGANAL